MGQISECLSSGLFASFTHKNEIGCNFSHYKCAFIQYMYSLLFSATVIDATANHLCLLLVERGSMPMSIVHKYSVQHTFDMEPIFWEQGKFLSSALLTVCLH